MTALAENNTPKNDATSTTAKVFMSGRSQAVRIPKAFRFESDEVYIFKNELGQIILSTKPIENNGWGDFFERFAGVDDVPEDFLIREKYTEKNRDFFADFSDE